MLKRLSSVGNVALAADAWGNTEEVIKKRKELRLDYPARFANIFDPRFRGRLVEHDEKKRSVCEVDRS